MARSQVDHNLLGMDFVRLRCARWRGELPPDSRAVPVPLLSASELAAAQGGEASGGEPRAALSAYRTQPGYCHVWTRGRTHGLSLQSVAERRTCVELEMDALVSEILNARDVVKTPLQAARADVRLVQSLSQVWREEEERRRAAGLPQLSSSQATPESAALKR